MTDTVVSTGSVTLVGESVAVTVTVALAPSSAPAWLRLSTITVGAVSVSLIASVRSVMSNPPAVPETVTVSPGSAIASSVGANWKVPVPLVAPGEMVTVRSSTMV